MLKLMRYTKDSSKEHKANCEPTFKLRAYMFKKPPVEGGFLVVRSGRIDLGSGVLRHSLAGLPTHQITTIVILVSPSAVWYTNYQ